MNRHHCVHQVGITRPIYPHNDNNKLPALIIAADPRRICYTIEYECGGSKGESTAWEGKTKKAQ